MRYGDSFEYGANRITVASWFYYTRTRSVSAASRRGSSTQLTFSPVPFAADVMVALLIYLLITPIYYDVVILVL